MKSGKVITISILIFIAGMFSIENRISYGQGVAVKNIGRFAKAAQENSQLSRSLSWTLSHQAQRGWYLYVPLIQKTIDTEAKPNTEKFAYSICKWQRKMGIKADGVLNKKTLYSLIEFWQSRRIKRIVRAAENELISAPIADFFDPTRSIDLLKVEKETHEAYKRMVSAAIADNQLNLKISGNMLAKDEKFLKIISSYRSPAYQAILRKREPNAGRYKIAFRSTHFTGRALDIYVGGDPVDTKDSNRVLQVQTLVYKWLVKNAGKFGFYPYFYEPWHWEYVPQNRK